MDQAPPPVTGRNVELKARLDDVDGLGAFVELEAVEGPAGDLDACTAAVAHLRTALGIADADVESRGYAQLLSDAR